jgi:hypothetical protein
MFYSIKVINFADMPSIFNGYFTQLVNIIKEKHRFISSPLIWHYHPPFFTKLSGFTFYIRNQKNFLHLIYHRMN